MKSINFGLLSFSLIVLPVAAAFGDEENALEEVMVTAQKREQSVLEIPIAVTVLSGEALLDEFLAGVVAATGVFGVTLHAV